MYQRHYHHHLHHDSQQCAEVMVYVPDMVNVTRVYVSVSLLGMDMNVTYSIALVTKRQEQIVQVMVYVLEVVLVNALVDGRVHDAVIRFAF